MYFAVLNWKKLITSEKEMHVFFTLLLECDFRLSLLWYVHMGWCILCRGPTYGYRGKVLLTFEDNGSSKIGVRFDRIIPEGNDLGGLCEEDHGFFCAGKFLCSWVLEFVVHQGTVNPFFFGGDSLPSVQPIFYVLRAPVQMTLKSLPLMNFLRYVLDGTMIRTSRINLCIFYCIICSCQKVLTILSTM